MIFFLRVLVSSRTCGRFRRVREKNPTTFANLIFNQYECDACSEQFIAKLVPWSLRGRALPQEPITVYVRWLSSYLCPKIPT
jgi:hypothetical protein